VSGAGHREVDHTADLGFELWAPELEGLFSEGVLALAEICYERASVRPLQQRELIADGANNEERLVRWLQEVYLLLEADLWLVAGVSGVTMSGDRVQGTLRGESFDRERHTLHTEIKAITYHDLDVRLDDELWRTTVIVDV